jgi:mRNA interferase ChpB
VLSPKKFNRFGSTLIAPVSQEGQYAREKGFTVSLAGTGIMTQGVVLLNNIRMLDISARQSEKVDIAPDYIVNECIAKLQAIIEI